MARDDSCHKHKKAAPIVGAVEIRLLSVDNTRPAIMVNISVVIAVFDDDGFVVVVMITVADDVTIPVPVPVTIFVTLSNRYSNRANTNPDLFRSSRHYAVNSSHGSDHYGVLNHCALLSLLNLGRPMPGRYDRSRFRHRFCPSMNMF
jgi:hypothetical protein